MYKVTLKKQFRKDFALMKRRGMPLDELQTAITVLASGSTLAPRYKDHPLKGDLEVRCTNRGVKRSRIGTLVSGRNSHA